MRCLTLASALAERGATCVFALNEMGAALVDRFGGGRFETRQPIQTSASSQAEAFDALVMDDYTVSAEHEQVVREQTRTLVVIDDLADRPHLSDLLIDPGYGRQDADYDGLLPATASRLTGPHYALVKPTFAASRASALARPVPTWPSRMFMSFGLSDVGGVAAHAVELVRAAAPELQIDLALASDAQSLAPLQISADSKLRLHVDCPDVASLMAEADLAIGAGGASTWERCCLGLPTLAVIVADNQRTMIETLAKAGAVLAVDLEGPDFDQTFGEALQRLMQSETRVGLKTASAGLCDGLGAERVAEAILAL